MFHDAEKNIRPCPRLAENSQRALRPPRPAGYRTVQKHCAAQAEYGRLAAQAYSPSDTMSQARICLALTKKVQRRPKQTCRAMRLKRGLRRPYLFEGGVVLQIFPRRRRPRRIAPCGGVVWLRAEALGQGATSVMALPGEAARY